MMRVKTVRRVARNLQLKMNINGTVKKLIEFGKPERT